MRNVLYKTTNLLSLAALLKVSEQKVLQLHDKHIRALEGRRFSHKKFVD